MEPIFHLVARAVIVKEGRVLVAQLIGEHSFLPGGHVELGEGSETCLVRELQEELGVTCQVERYLGLGEQTYQDKDGLHHVVSHFFEVTSDELSVDKVPESKESHLRFYWAEVDALESYKVFPVSIQSLVPAWAAGESQVWWFTEFPKEEVTA